LSQSRKKLHGDVSGWTEFSELKTGSRRSRHKGPNQSISVR